MNKNQDFSDPENIFNYLGGILQKGDMKAIATFLKDPGLNDMLLFPLIMKFVSKKTEALGEQRQTAIIKVFLEKGFTAKELLLERHTPLSFIQIALDNHADIDVKGDDNGNPLHAAVLSDYKVNERIDFFLSEKNINSQKNDGFLNTPLHLLIANENARGSRYLIQQALQKGIEVNYNMQDSLGKTPIALACATLQNDAVMLLLECQQKGGNVDVNIADNQGKSALHYACLLGQAKIARALVNAGAKIDARDKFKRTPLDYCNAIVDVTVQKDISESLKSVSIDPARDKNALYNTLLSTHGNQMPLSFNPRKKGLESWELPANIGSIQKTKNKLKNLVILTDQLKKLLALTVVSAGKNWYAVNMMIEILMTEDDKVFIEKQIDSFTGVSITERCFQQQQAVRDELKAEIANVDMGLELRNAAFANDIVKLKGLLAIIDSTVVNATGGEGSSLKTALHQAASRGNKECVIELLKHKGIKLDLNDKDRQTPFDLARLNNHTEILKLLLDANVQISHENSDESDQIESKFIQTF